MNCLFHKGVNMISMEKRIFLFDNLKFFLILTVVIGHFIDYITKSSHMMSGLFYFTATII